MNKLVTAIRGATGCKNDKEEVIKNVCDLFNQIVETNHLTTEDIISIQFTSTKDINVMNPAAALRRGTPCIDVTPCALFCMQEPDIINSPEFMIRIMITTYMDTSIPKTNVYINGGEKLRPDYCKK